jgi:hypothetical protein
MNNIIENRLQDYLLKRKMLLWIIKEPSIEETKEHDVVKILAKFYWNACWTEDTNDHFYDMAKQIADQSPRKPEKGIFPRQPYRMSSDPDKEGDIDRHSFLPIYEINGSSRSGESEGSSDAPRTRRQAYRLNQMRKLEIFHGFALLAVGAQHAEDVRTLAEAMEFCPPGMDVFLSLPAEGLLPKGTIPEHINLHVISADIKEIVSELHKNKSPEATSTVRLGIRYGETEIEVSETEFGSLEQDFSIIKSNDLLPQKDIQQSIQDQVQALGKSDINWALFKSGIVFDREYFVGSKGKEKLFDYILHSLKTLRDNSDLGNLTIQIKATSGSGITTTIRDVSYKCASQGYPTLVCKSCCQSFSKDRILAFLTTLRERSPLNEEIPSFIVFDREHHSLEDASTLASNLDGRGRSTIVLQVIPAAESSGVDLEHEARPAGRHVRLPLFSGHVEQSEITDLCNHFTNLFRGEGIPAPSVRDWEKYQARNAFTVFAGGKQPDSLFWIALHFFLRSRDPVFDISGWILRVCDQEVPDIKSKRLLRILAAYSAFGIPVPLTSLMRSLGYKTVYDTAIISILNKLAFGEEVLDWFPWEDEIEDQAIGFRHRLLALKLLELLNIENWADPLEECGPVIELLKPTSAADRWLIEALVFEAMRPAGRIREPQERLLRILKTFRVIPSVIAEKSRAIQHHWARTLQQISRSINNPEQQVEYLREAVGKLISAEELSGKFHTREHPRNILNTLGAVRAELSRCYRLMGKDSDADQTWQDSASAFERALGYGADNYVTLSAYSDRLLDHASETNLSQEAKLVDLTLANTLLIRALEIQGIPKEDEEYLTNRQLRVYTLLDQTAVQDYLNALEKTNKELWALTVTQEKLRNLSKDDWESGKKPELSEAFAILDDVYSLNPLTSSWRLLFLLHKVTNRLSLKRYNFEYRLTIFDRLATTTFKWDTKMRFIHCVLCYQCGEFIRGQSLFRELRTAFNSGQLEPTPMADFWRDKTKPELARIATIKVERVDSDWRAYGSIPEMNGQSILLRPRWFIPPATLHEVKQCNISFNTWGPIALPLGRDLHSSI